MLGGSNDYPESNVSLPTGLGVAIVLTIAVGALLIVLGLFVLAALVSQ